MKKNYNPVLAIFFKPVVCRCFLAYLKWRGKRLPRPVVLIEHAYHDARKINAFILVQYSETSFFPSVTRKGVLGAVKWGTDCSCRSTDVYLQVNSRSEFAILALVADRAAFVLDIFSMLHFFFKFWFIVFILFLLFNISSH